MKMKELGLAAAGLLLMSCSSATKRYPAGAKDLSVTDKFGVTIVLSRSGDDIHVRTCEPHTVFSPKRSEFLRQIKEHCYPTFDPGPIGQERPPFGEFKIPVSAFAQELMNYNYDRVDHLLSPISAEEYGTLKAPDLDEEELRSKKVELDSLLRFIEVYGEGPEDRRLRQELEEAIARPSEKAKIRKILTQEVNRAIQNISNSDRMTSMTTTTDGSSFVFQALSKIAPRYRPFNCGGTGRMKEDLADCREQRGALQLVARDRSGNEVLYDAETGLLVENLRDQWDFHHDLDCGARFFKTYKVSWRLPTLKEAKTLGRNRYSQPGRYLTSDVILGKQMAYYVSPESLKTTSRPIIVLDGIDLDERPIYRRCVAPVK